MKTPLKAVSDALCEDDLGKSVRAQMLIKALTVDGFAIVPVIPTEEMIEAGDDTDHTIEAMSGHPEYHEQIANFWHAMVRAAPK